MVFKLGSIGLVDQNVISDSLTSGIIVGGKWIVIDFRCKHDWLKKQDSKLKLSSMRRYRTYKNIDKTMVCQGFLKFEALLQ